MNDVIRHLESELNDVKNDAKAYDGGLDDVGHVVEGNAGDIRSVSSDISVVHLLSRYRELDDETS